MRDWGWLRRAADAAGGPSEDGRGRAVAGVAVAVADGLGVQLPPLALLTAWGDPLSVELPAGPVEPALVGLAAGALLDVGVRRRSGAVYTPPAVAGAVAGWALGASSAASPVVCDPAVGGGAFLLAAAEALVERGHTPGAAVGLLVGLDTDPVAVAAAQATLALWCAGAAVPRVVLVDALAPEAWPVVPDVVLGNPPFLTPLRRRTAAERRTAPAPYTDAAALFLSEAVRRTAPDGAVALVLPESVLATRDAGPVRRGVLTDASLEVLWVPGTPVFEGVAVRVCAVVMGRDRPRRGPVRRYVGMPPRPLPTVEVDADELARLPTWSHLLAEAVPACALEGGPPLGGLASVTAGFREEYYGLSPFVVDDPDGELDPISHPPLVTVGLIDPAACRWGLRPTRYRRKPWAAPRVDLAALRAGGRLGPWAAARLAPKVVVASQTRVVEAAVDESGAWLPCTPVISVAVPAERVWHVAAALLAPPVSAWAQRIYAGTGLSGDTIRLSAATLRALPLPSHAQAWDEAATAVRRATAASDEPARRANLLDAAHAACHAYGTDPEPLVDWWAARLPEGRR